MCFSFIVFLNKIGINVTNINVESFAIHFV